MTATSKPRQSRSEKPAENDLHRVFLNSDAHVDRLFALHYRLVGKILAQADEGEKLLSPASRAPAAAVV